MELETKFLRELISNIIGANKVYNNRIIELQKTNNIIMIIFLILICLLLLILILYYLNKK